MFETLFSSINLEDTISQMEVDLGCIEQLNYRKEEIDSIKNQFEEIKKIIKNTKNIHNLISNAVIKDYIKKEYPGYLHMKKLLIQITFKSSSSFGSVHVPHVDEQSRAEIKNADISASKIKNKKEKKSTYVDFDVFNTF